MRITHESFRKGQEAAARAEQEKSSTLSDIATYASYAGAIGTLPMALKSARTLFKGGRTRIMHGTSKSKAAKIRKEGLSGKRAVEEGSITDDMLKQKKGQWSEDEINSFDNLVYGTKNAQTARSYSTVSELMEQEGLTLAEAQAKAMTEHVGDVANPFGKGRGDVVDFDIPLYDKSFASRKIKNPELRGKDNWRDWKTTFEKNKRDAVTDEQFKQIYDQLDEAEVFKGDIGAEFVANNKSYMHELPDYFRAKPGQALGHVGKASAPLVLTATGLAMSMTEEGLHPQSQGMGAKSIRKHSEFGSGYQGIKALATIAKEAPVQSIVGSKKNTMFDGFKKHIVNPDKKNTMFDGLKKHIVNPDRPELSDTFIKRLGASTVKPGATGLFSSAEGSSKTSLLAGNATNSAVMESASFNPSELLGFTNKAGVNGGRNLDPDMLGVPDGVGMNIPEGRIMQSTKVYDLSSMKTASRASMKMSMDVSGSEATLSQQIGSLAGQGNVRIRTSDDRSALNPQSLANKIHERL